MILLDTHIWIWWLEGDPRLTPRRLSLIQSHMATQLGVSVISCWETAQLASRGRVHFSVTVRDWIGVSLVEPGVVFIELTPEIAVEANYLPQPFHRDPVDQILVATARILNCPILTADRRILAYPHVTCLT